jgi:hypothetical protein
LVVGKIETLGGLAPELVMLLAIFWIAIVTALFFVLSIYLMKRRLIK